MVEAVVEVVVMVVAAALVMAGTVAMVVLATAAVAKRDGAHSPSRRWRHCGHSETSSRGAPAYCACSRHVPCAAAG
eukprot:5622153-Prymnesium_polylepis.1